MSTLRVSTIQDTAGSNSSTPAAIANGIAKAWVNFNGTGTVAIRASYNVSSITDNGAGDYTVNFTSSFADANYGFALSKDMAVSDISGYNSVLTAKTIASGSLRILVNYSNSVNGDTAACSVAIFR